MEENRDSIIVIILMNELEDSYEKYGKRKIKNYGGR